MPLSSPLWQRGVRGDLGSWRQVITAKTFGIPYTLNKSTGKGNFWINSVPSALTQPPGLNPPSPPDRFSWRRSASPAVIIRIHAGIQRLTSVTSPLFSGTPPARMRHRCGTTPPIRYGPWEKTLKKRQKRAKKDPKMRQKWVKKWLRGDQGVWFRYRGANSGQSLRGAAAGRGDDGLELRQGRGLVVVDHQVVIPVGFFQFSPAIGQAPGQFLGVQAPPALQGAAPVPSGSGAG